jgi:hypothetical protein
MSPGSEAGAMPQPHADPVLFADREDFRAWLAEHHDIETELWLLIRKKGSPLDGRAPSRSRSRRIPTCSPSR